MVRTKTKPFLKRKKVPKFYFHFGQQKSVLPSLLAYTWRCENITASPCGWNRVVVEKTEVPPKPEVPEENRRKPKFLEKAEVRGENRSSKWKPKLEKRRSSCRKHSWKKPKFPLKVEVSGESRRFKRIPIILKNAIERIKVNTCTWGYVPLVVSTSRSFPHSWFITGLVTRLTRRVPLVEQELLILPEHLSSLPVFSGVRATRSLVLCVCFVDHCLSFCTFSFGHGVVSFSSIYGFWLPLWYLQTVLFIPRYRSLFHCHIDVIILNCYSTTAPDNADKPIL
jgi:hypothetical protein